MEAGLTIIDNNKLINGMPFSLPHRQFVYSKLKTMDINEIRQLYINLYSKSRAANAKKRSMITYFLYFLSEYIRVSAGVAERDETLAIAKFRAGDYEQSRIEREFEIEK